MSCKWSKGTSGLSAVQAVEKICPMMFWVFCWLSAAQAVRTSRQSISSASGPLSAAQAVRTMKGGSMG